MEVLESRIELVGLFRYAVGVMFALQDLEGNGDPVCIGIWRITDAVKHGIPEGFKIFAAVLSCRVGRVADHLQIQKGPVSTGGLEKLAVGSCPCSHVSPIAASTDTDPVRINKGIFAAGLPDKVKQIIHSRIVKGMLIAVVLLSISGATSGIGKEYHKPCCRQRLEFIIQCCRIIPGRTAMAVENCRIFLLPVHRRQDKALYPGRMIQCSYSKFKRPLESLFM